MPIVRRGQHPRTRLGSRDLWRIFDGAGLRAVDEARSGKNAARRQHCGRDLRRDAPGTGRGAFALERCGFCQCGPPWRLFGLAGPRRNDRAGADFRRPDGFRKTTRRFVRQGWRRFCEAPESVQRRGGNGGHDSEHQHQILAGRISQPECDRGRVVFATSRSAIQRRSSR